MGKYSSSMDGTAQRWKYPQPLPLPQLGDTTLQPAGLVFNWLLLPPMGHVVKRVGMWLGPATCGRCYPDMCRVRVRGVQANPEPCNSNSKARATIKLPCYIGITPSSRSAMRLVPHPSTYLFNTLPPPFSPSLPTGALSVAGPPVLPRCPCSRICVRHHQPGDMDSTLSRSLMRLAPPPPTHTYTDRLPELPAPTPHPRTQHHTGALSVPCAPVLPWGPCCRCCVRHHQP